MPPPSVLGSNGKERPAGLSRKGPLTGRLLAGKWRVGHLLGRGGMSSVYATTHRNGKAYAIKVLHADLAINRSMRGRFLQEGYIANRVGHEAVVSVLDEEVTADGIVFLVLELLEGATVERYCQIRGGMLAADEVLTIADGVLDVLTAAHEKGVVHRDIKPSNVFLTSKGTLKVLDFGIARLREISGRVPATRTGFVLGTPGFIAPEQARGRSKEIDARTDLWGLGATMFRLLTGRLVHEGETTNESVIASATEQAPPVASIRSSLAPSVAAVVDRALAIDPRDRWQTAVEMQAALRVEREKLPPCSLPRPACEPEPSTLDEAVESEEADAPLGQQRSRRVVHGHRSVRPVVRIAIYATLGLGTFVVLVLSRRHAAKDSASSMAFPERAPAASTSERSATPERGIVSLPPRDSAPEPAPTASAPEVQATAKSSGPKYPPRAPRQGGARRAAGQETPPALSSSVPTRLEDVLDERR